jgi:hypothetical protein
MVALSLALALLLGGPALAAPIYHEPPRSTEAGELLDLTITAGDPLEVGALELVYRRVGERQWRTLGFERVQGDEFRARVPADEVLGGGLEYFIRARSGDTLTDRFASEAAPQRVTVYGESEVEDFERELSRYDGQRSRASASFSYINFGAQQDVPDSLMQYGADFTYRVLGELRSLRFGVSRMRAEALGPPEETDETDEDPPPTAVSTGYDHGFAELEVGIGDYVGLKGQVQLGANLERFTAGGEGRLRIGLDPGTHVEIYGGGAGGVGGYGGLELAWDTVPRVPMVAGAEVSTFPNQGDPAVLWHFGAEFPAGEHLDLQLTARYQARTALYGGLGGSLGFSWSF